MKMSLVVNFILKFPIISHFRMRRLTTIKLEQERLESIKLEQERLESIRVIEKSYGIGRFSIELSPGHALHHYQSVHPFYDKFPLFITKYLPGGTDVIQVGANVGDTLASMVTGNSSLNFFCIEADSGFFDFLRTNIETMHTFCKFEVEAINKMVAQEINFKSLEGSSGTKKGVEATPGDDLLETVSLDKLFESREMRNVSLLMVDVDGFDFDVIKSAQKIIEQSSPILYFEVMPLNEGTTEKYLELMENLELSGYLHWSVFDNFGNLMLNDVTREVAAQVLTYSLLQNLAKGTRSIYYLDIYCSTEKYRKAYENSITEYREFMLK